MNESAKALGGIITERKSASSRANIAKANAARVPAVLPCTCVKPRDDGTHTAHCRIRIAEKQREYRKRVVPSDYVLAILAR